MHDEEARKLVVLIRDLMDKEVKERKAAVDELWRKHRELVSDITRERHAREQGDAILVAQGEGMQHALEAEKSSRVSEMAIRARASETLEAHIAEQISGICEKLRALPAERVLAQQRCEKQWSELRTVLQLEKSEREAALCQMEKTLQTTTRELEQHKRERIDNSEEYRRSFVELRAQLQTFQNEITSEKNSCTGEFSLLRMALKNFDSKVTAQFQDYQVVLQNEILQRLDFTNELEQRMSDIRNAVLDAVYDTHFR